MACRHAVDSLLTEGGSLTSYRANPAIGVGPRRGSWTHELERSIEHRFGIKYAIATSSGTAALHVSLLALNLKPGSEVIVSPLTFSASAAAIILAGLVPVFADVSKETFLLDPKKVKRAITQKTKAILSVDLFGRVGSYRDLQKFQLPVVWDSCQAVGCKSEFGAYSGTVGAAGAYSFGSCKQVPAGEGGCVVTNDHKIATAVRLLINHAENFTNF